MSLPDAVPAKVSSEAAGFINLTPVGREELAITDLIERILAVTGKDADRIAAVLERGSFVSGASRYRWERFDAATQDVAAILDRFPDPQPDRAFDAARCQVIVLRGRRGQVEIRAEFARERRLLKRRNYWDRLLSLVEAQSLSYSRYAYGEKADVYTVELPFETVKVIEQEADLLKYTAIVQQIRHLQVTSAELYVER